MQIKVGTDYECAEITLLEKTPQGTIHAGDARVSVSVRLQDFAGRHDAVWLEADALQAFVVDLRALEARRQGVATLRSMSPDEFVLTLRSRDTLGHLVAEVCLVRHQYSSGPAPWRTLVSGGFELEPGALADITEGFASL
ncbi:hypothetical protein QWZ03_15570 [Chitinimonas viridis]|uniref:Uncharacterized protein n=1 Tax=Chitinimonas viridis TaxID=664880 RepID=A0ABT8B973_9NEIS|nr:hypothetical protein [Chitinimonas viridis]MDN3578186.1 hypothetical protein [Chitinimonas viridis]